MSTQTDNLKLNKPDANDFYDITVQNENMDKIDTAYQEIKKSVSDGKTLVANAITGKGVTTATDAEFATMATNIGNIKVGTDVTGATASASDILAGKTAGVGSSIITGTMPDFLGKNLGYQPSGETYTDDGTPVTRLYLSSYVAMKKASNSLPLIRIKLGTSGAVNADTYVDVPVNNLSEGNIKAGTLVGYSAGGIGVTGTFTADGTATAAQILKDKIAYVNGSKVTGSMADNGAVSQALAINGTYTIPAGYHNGSGKVTQSITTKDAATYTPGDSAQTIAAGQYLNGVQTISAVPTETQTVTAGTSAKTVNRNTGKYMTAVTVNPTPSQTKSVTLTSSPMTFYPDAGNLLSAITVSGSLRQFTSGTVTGISPTATSKSFLVFTSGYYHSQMTKPYYTINVGFVPAVVFYMTTATGGTINDETWGFISNYALFTHSGYTYNAHMSGTRSMPFQYQTTIGTSIDLMLQTYNGVPETCDIAWYAFA